MGKDGFTLSRDSSSPLQPASGAGGGNGGGGSDSSGLSEELGGVSDNGNGNDYPDGDDMEVKTEMANGGGGKEPAREAAGDVRSQGDWGDINQDPKTKLNPNTMLNKSGGDGRTLWGVGKTLGMAKTVIMAAVLISVAGAGVDVYQTYNDAIEIDLEKHITDADFELSEDKSEISGSVGFDIPEMGLFEKSIIASVHVTVLESNPTTDGDYEFEYTLGSGEHFYDFTLDDLDPVTVEKIEAGQPLDIEYSGTISVTYLGIEIPSVTMDIPLTTTTVETA